MKPLVIYHASCADGFGAMWSFWRWFKDTAEYLPGKYQDEPPDVTGRDVYLLDFSYKRDVVASMLKIANKVVLIDHHKSALEDLADLEGLEDSYCSLEESGCILAWRYAQDNFWGGTRPPPMILQHIQDRDLWKFELEDTRAVSAVLFSKPLDVLVWNELIINSDVTLASGRILDEQAIKNAKSIISQSLRSIEMDGYQVPLINTPGMFTSDIGNWLSEKEPFAAMYYDTKEARVFSLRSNRMFEGWVDVSKVALKYGGGGHPHAAGFRVNRDHYLAKV